MNRDVDFGMLVVVDSDMRPSRLSETVSIKDGEVTHGALPSMMLDQPDERALFIILDHANLAGTVHGFDPSDPSSVSVQIARPPDSPTTAYRADGWLTTAHIPADTVVLDASTGEPITDRRVFEYLRLVATVNPEFCSQGQTNRTTPFGSSGSILPSEDEPLVDSTGAGSRRIEHLIALDDDTLIGAHFDYLFLARRNETVPPVPAIATRPSQAINLSAIAGRSLAGSALFGVAMDPRPRDDGRRTLLLAGRTSDREGLLMEVIVDARGFEPIGTATVAVSPLPALQDVTFDAQGNALVTGVAGFVLVRRAGESTFEAGPKIDSQRLIRRIISTGDPAAPHFLTSDDGSVYQGNVITGELDSVSFAGSVASLHVTSVALANDELWIGSKDGLLLVRSSNGAWNKVEVIAPPSMDLCSVPLPDGSRTMLSEIEDMTTDGEYLYAIYVNCSAIGRIRLRDRCISPIGRGEEPINVSPLRNRALLVHGQELFLSGDRGLLHTFTMR